MWSLVQWLDQLKWSVSSMLTLTGWDQFFLFYSFFYFFVFFYFFFFFSFCNVCSSVLQMRPGWASTPWRTATRCRRPTPGTAASPPPPASSTCSWASATPTSSPRPAPVNQLGPRGWPSPPAEAQPAVTFDLRHLTASWVWNHSLAHSFTIKKVQGEYDHWITGVISDAAFVECVIKLFVNLLKLLWGPVRPASCHITNELTSRSTKWFKWLAKKKSVVRTPCCHQLIIESKLPGYIPLFGFQRSLQLAYCLICSQFDKSQCSITQMKCLINTSRQELQWETVPGSGDNAKGQEAAPHLNDVSSNVSQDPYLLILIGPGVTYLVLKLRRWGILMTLWTEDVQVLVWNVFAVKWKTLNLN